MQSDNSLPLNKLHPALAVLQVSNSQIWLQAVGRGLCQIGSGLIYFYIPLVFVNQVGLSATSVGFSMGLSSLTGILGHILGGVLADSPRFGRKVTLLVSGAVGAIVSIMLAFTMSLPWLVAANLCLGLSVGFYWTAADAAVMDVTQPEERSQCFAIMSVAESLGNGIGILGGGLLLLWVHQSPVWLFLTCGLVFLVFVGMVQFTMPETSTNQMTEAHAQPGLWIALTDVRLLLFILANLLFTTYIALVNTTIPLYFTKFVPAISGGGAASATSAAQLFTWCYIGAGVVLQLPIAQVFGRMHKVRVLMVALFLWALSFGLVWVTGIAVAAPVVWGVGALGMMALASVTYKPFAAAIVAELAPPSLRGAYIAVSSQCWAIGYFIGPTLGGWAMDQSPAIAHHFWLGTAATTLIGFLVLLVFNQVHTASNATISDASQDLSQSPSS